MILGTIIICLGTSCSMVGKEFDTVEACEAEATALVVEYFRLIPSITNIGYTCGPAGTGT